MFRTCAILSLTTACGALVIAGLELAAIAAAPPVAEADAGARAPTPRITTATHEPTAKLAFAPVFGVAGEPKQAVLRPEPEAVRSLDHRLTGILIADDTRWAVLDGEAGTLVLREGEMIDARARIARVASDHVEVLVDGVALTLEFAGQSETAPVAVAAEVEPPKRPTTGKAGAAPHRAMVGSVQMSREEVMALVALAQTR